MSTSPTFPHHDYHVVILAWCHRRGVMGAGIFMVPANSAAEAAIRYADEAFFMLGPDTDFIGVRAGVCI